MSSELSWDHVAFLFYTTKGVVSAVGQGSRTAARVKEFTLQYITDTFASWIINQGGFVSVPVSSHARLQKSWYTFVIVNYPAAPRHIPFNPVPNSGECACPLKLLLVTIQLTKFIWFWRKKKVQSTHLQ